MITVVDDSLFLCLSPLDIRPRRRHVLFTCFTRVNTCLFLSLSLSLTISISTVMADIEKLAKVEDDVVVDGNIYPPAPADEDITVFYYPSKYCFFFFFLYQIHLNLIVYSFYTFCQTDDGEFSIWMISVIAIGSLFLVFVGVTIFLIWYQLVVILHHTSCQPLLSCRLSLCLMYLSLSLSLSLVLRERRLKAARGTHPSWLRQSSEREILGLQNVTMEHPLIKLSHNKNETQETKS